MKKWVVALLVVLVVLVVVAVGGMTVVYFRVYKPMFAATTYASASRMLEGRIANKAAFRAPASGELTPAQVTRFVAVETRVEKQVGARLATFRREYELLRGASRGPASRDLRRSMGEIGGVYMRAKETLVSALNEAGLSQEEYEWIREQVFTAAGLPFARLEIQELLVDPGNPEQVIRIRREPARDAGDRNRQLVAPFALQLEQWLPLVFFDL